MPEFTKDGHVKSGRFVCPKCGGFQWGTNIIDRHDRTKDIGSCHGEKVWNEGAYFRHHCDFTWQRKDDRLYFVDK